MLVRGFKQLIVTMIMIVLLEHRRKKSKYKGGGIVVGEEILSGSLEGLIEAHHWWIPGRKIQAETSRHV